MLSIIISSKWRVTCRFSWAMHDNDAGGWVARTNAVLKFR